MKSLDVTYKVIIGTSTRPEIRDKEVMDLPVVDGEFEILDTIIALIQEQ